MQEPPLVEYEQLTAGWNHHLNADLAVVNPPARLLFLSGVGAEDSDAPDISQARILGDGTVAGQTRVAYSKIATYLTLYGADYRNIVKLTTYATATADLHEYFATQAEFIHAATRPPHSFYRINGFGHPDMLIEIDVIAAVAPPSGVRLTL